MGCKARSLNGAVRFTYSDCVGAVLERIETTPLENAMSWPL